MMQEQDELMVTPQAEESVDSSEHICTDPGVCAVSPVSDVVDSAEKAVSKKKKTCSAKMVGLAVAAVVLLSAGGASAYVYTHPVTDRVVQKLTKYVPFPAMIVGRSVVTYQQYYQEEEALNRYFASAGTQAGQVPTKDQLQTLITQTLANKAVVQKLADDYGVRLDSAKTQEYYNEFIQSTGGSSQEEVQKQIKETFGWTPEQFKERVIQPVALSTEVNNYIEKSAFFQKPVRDAIDQAYKRVTVGGEDFVKVGDEVHAKNMVNIKSDLGFVKKSDLPTAWGSNVADLETGKMTDVIELPKGYAFFKVADRIKSQEVSVSTKKKGEKTEETAVPTDEQLHLLAITLPKMTLDTVAKQYVEEHKPIVLIKQ